MKGLTHAGTDKNMSGITIYANSYQLDDLMYLQLHQCTGMIHHQKVTHH